MGKGSRARKQRKTETSTKLARQFASAAARIGSAEGPPLEAVEAYVSAYEWADEFPGEAKMLKGLSEDTVLAFVLGIAYAEQMGHTEQECLQRAANIVLWCIFNGFMYLYEWPEPVATYTDEQIIALIRKDAARGYWPPLVKD